MALNDEFAADLRQSEAPTGVIVSALRWEILNDWVRYLHDDAFPDKTVEKSYLWGFVKRDFGGDALRCLWGKYETSYAMFAEAVWLLHREFSEGAGAEHHALFAGLPPIPAEVLFQKIASASAVAFRRLTEDEMGRILRKAPQDYVAMG
ncbi:hypothetical protein ACFYXF_51370 [Streptomyces sp. NPDC002680]|uniref:hypothetical protein n=1 Tax=Streptomyces sp. NPDC002680 TaxID=3364659 RepID=UPI0036A2FDD4